MKNNWVVGVNNAKTVKHDNYGKSKLSPRPVVLQIANTKCGRVSKALHNALIITMTVFCGITGVYFQVISQDRSDSIRRVVRDSNMINKC